MPSAVSNLALGTTVIHNFSECVREGRSTMGRKSPQEKKELEYTKDHFTFGWNSSRAFPKTWKRKKTNLNREYRRKSGELSVWSQDRDRTRRR